MQKNNLNAIARGLSASSELGSERYRKPQRSERSCRAVHEALDRQEVWATAEKSEDKLEVNSKMPENKERARKRAGQKIVRSKT